ncbi:nitroreductase family protein [Thioalkalivibrio sp. AKL7]|uniref:Acg family FMN-binding oxidoreductase n=1 Tax=Thioalkalivibrio sp. AKL7 TaxID=1158155 RepID=UPI00036D357C|nr:nitroreductase family protein [Thioalkalivibrio sp. AKL7]
MESLVEALIPYAVRAPSGHNTQPWQFTVEQDTIRIYPDPSRRLPVVDPDDHALFISLGCALENLVVAAAQQGLAARIDYFPSGEPEECLRVRFSEGADEDTNALFQAIPQRQSNRGTYDGKAINDSDLARMLEANPCDSVAVRAFRVGDPKIEPIIGFVREGNIAQFNDPAFVAELVSWIRFSRREVSTRQDGLAAAALGFPSVPRWLGNWIMTTLVKPDGEAARQDKAIRSSSLLLIFIARVNDKRHWVDVGRSFERVVLTAASLDIAHAHVNMPCEVEPIRRRLATHLGLEPGEQPLLLIRLGYARKRMPPSPRRPIDQVIRERGAAMTGSDLEEFRCA